MAQDSATDGYVGNKKRTNLSLDKTLVKWAKTHFKKTHWRSMSNALEAHLRTLKFEQERKAAKKAAATKANKEIE